MALAVGLSACGGGGSGGHHRYTLRIGDLVPLTGALGDFGPPGRKAAELAVRQIDAADREAGARHTVALLTADERTDPAASVAAARKLIRGGASCIVGAWAGPDTVSVSQGVTTPDGIPEISPASTGADITSLRDDGYLTRTASPDSLQGGALAAEIADALGGAAGRTVNVGARADSYGRSITTWFERAWKARGGRVGRQVLWDPSAPSYNSEAQSMVAGNPDAWLIADFPATYQKVAPALLRTGRWTARRTFFSDGLASATLPRDLGSAATEGMRGTAPGTAQTGALARAFTKLYVSSPPPAVKRQTFDAQAFDATVLCYLASVAAGKADGSAMRDRIRQVSGPPGTKYTWQQLPQAIKDLEDGKDIDYEGASGPIDLDGHGDPTEGVYDVLQFRQGTLMRLRQLTQRAPGQ
jgi:ABC-type branched-subunit amino acid transport system substrate-binding protein